MNAILESTLANLTAATTGTTGFAPGACIHHAFSFVVALNGSTNVVVRLEGTLDGTNYFHLDEAMADTTMTTDGTYRLVGAGPLNGIRLYFVSEAGGTGAVISSITYLGRS